MSLSMMQYSFFQMASQASLTQRQFPYPPSSVCWVSGWPSATAGHNPTATTMKLRSSKVCTKVPSHKSYNASDKYPTVHRFVTEMCTCAHFCYKMVHCGISYWCLVGVVQQVHWYWRMRECIIFTGKICQLYTEEPFSQLRRVHSLKCCSFIAPNDVLTSERAHIQNKSCTEKTRSRPVLSFPSRVTVPKQGSSYGEFVIQDSRIQRILFKKVQSVTYIRNMWFVTINFHIYNLLCKNQTTGVHDDISMIRH